MNEALDRQAFIQAALQAGMRGVERRVLCACLALADSSGRFPVDMGALAPMSGNRRPYVQAALEVLIDTGWVRPYGQGNAQLMADPDADRQGH